MNRSTILALCLAAVFSGAALAAQHPKTKISAHRAAAIALKEYHGKLVGKVPLEKEGDRWEYAVRIRSGKVVREVMVDANSGKIEKTEITPTKKVALAKAAKPAMKKATR